MVDRAPIPIPALRLAATSQKKMNMFISGCSCGGWAATA